MFQKVLEYAGEYRKTTYLSMAVMLIGIVMNVLPFLFIYQLIRPLLLGESLEFGYAAWRVAAIAVCGVLYAVIYVKGLSLSHRAAYNTLKNLRLSLQGKLTRFHIDPPDMQTAAPYHQLPDVGKDRHRLFVKAVDVGHAGDLQRPTVLHCHMVLALGKALFVRHPPSLPPVILPIRI